MRYDIVLFFKRLENTFKDWNIQIDYNDLILNINDIVYIGRRVREEYNGRLYNTCSLTLGVPFEKRHDKYAHKIIVRILNEILGIDFNTNKIQKVIDKIHRKIDKKEFVKKILIGTYVSYKDIFQPTILFGDIGGWNTQLNVSIYEIAYLLNKYGEDYTIGILTKETGDMPFIIRL